MPSSSPSPAPARSRRLPLGLRLLKHTQGIVTTITALGVLHLRTTHSLYYVACSLGTSFTAKGLKKIIKAPRPSPSPSSSLGEKDADVDGVGKVNGSSKAGKRRWEERILPKSEHGMPSTHSATITFMGLYLLLANSSSSSPSSLLLLVPVGLLLPPLVMWSRIRLGLHTPAQTIAGAALGITTALLASYAWSHGAGEWLQAQIDPVLRASESRVGIDDWVREL